MIKIKEISSNRIVIEGRVENELVTRAVWMPIKKSLSVKNSVLMAYCYCAGTDETVFQFSAVSNVITEDEQKPYDEKMAYCLVAEATTRFMQDLREFYSADSLEARTERAANLGELCGYIYSALSGGSQESLA